MILRMGDRVSATYADVRAWRQCDRGCLNHFDRLGQRLTQACQPSTLMYADFACHNP